MTNHNITSFIKGDRIVDYIEVDGQNYFYFRGFPSNDNTIRCEGSETMNTFMNILIDSGYMSREL